MSERHIHLVVDGTDPRRLSTDDLPILPQLLPCATCGEPRSAHGPWSTCPLFVRPVLPMGHAYVDDLEVGSAFHFLDAGRATCRHVLTQRGPTGRFAPGLIHFDAAARRCGAAAHILHEATIVRICAGASPTARGQ